MRRLAQICDAVLPMRHVLRLAPSPQVGFVAYRYVHGGEQPMTRGSPSSSSPASRASTRRRSRHTRAPETHTADTTTTVAVAAVAVAPALPTPHAPRSLKSLLERTAGQVVIPAAQLTSVTPYGSRGTIGTDAALKRTGSETTPVASDGMYDYLLTHTFLNPFSGKITTQDSLVYRELTALGFSVDPDKPLQLRWRQSDLETSCQSVARKPGKRSSSSTNDGTRAPLTPTSLTSADSLRRLLQPFHVKAGGRATTATGKNTASSAPAAAADSSSSSALMTTATEARTRGWRHEVAEWFAREDFTRAIPTLLQQRYDELLSAYMPPKLDAVPDPTVVGVALTPDQQNTLTLALRGYHLFIGGSAGTGKTVLLKVIFRELAQRGLRVAMTATTGVAAVQLGGCTFHSAFEVPVSTPLNAGSSGARRPRWDVNALRAVDVVIIDEVSLLNAQVLDAFDAEARLARLSTAPFGGIQVILCGDFLQLSHDAMADALPAYLSAAFQHVVALQLMTPMRHRDGDALLTLLNALRKGEFDQDVFARLDRPIPSESEDGITYIFPRRREAQTLNDMKLCELSTEEMVCTPQRGPLELVGRFTPSALVELPALMRTHPSRLSVLGMVQEGLEHVLGGGGRHRRGVTSPVSLRLAEHDVVVMPCAPHLHDRLCFLLRVRFDSTRQGGCRRRRKDRREQTGGPGTDTASGAVDARICGAIDTAITDNEDENNDEVDTSHQQEQATRTISGTTTTTTTSSAAAALEADPTLWPAVCAYVAALLGGRLVQLFDEEPAGFVPLSVSRALADLTRSSDAAEALSPLRLKLGCRVMINRNLSRTVSNGSVGVVEAYVAPDPSLFPRHSGKSSRFVYQRLLEKKPFGRLPIVRLLSGEVVQIPPQARMLGGTAATYYYGHEVFSLPLQLGYGFTVHKVQGLTLSGTVVLDCQHFFECPHLLYVACSRVRSIDQLIVRHVAPNMLIVKRSALDFSQRLREARDPQVLSAPPHLPRAAWTELIKPRVFALSEA